MSLALPKPEKAMRKSRTKIDTSDLALPKLDPARDSAYRAYVRSHPCALKGRNDHHCAGPIECAHIRTAGFALKASDYASVPFCLQAHRIINHNYGWTDLMISYDFNPWHVAFWLLEKWHRMQVKA